MMHTTKTVDNGPMLNAYPDSLGGKLTHLATFLEKPQLKDVFSSFYILPSLFNTDLDRGFSVIDYSLNQMLAKEQDLERIEALGIDLKLDFILNHASVLSPQFQDLLKYGEDSEYKDFFINWNTFWENHGTMTKEGYIQPDENLIKDMFFRKPGLPILMVRFPEGRDVPYWNTFYQEIQYPVLHTQDIMETLGIQYATAVAISSLVNEGIKEGKQPKDLDFSGLEKYKEAVITMLDNQRRYLGQMDLNIQSPKVWDFYQNVLKQLAHYGAKIVRLDAFAYAPKAVGEKNFLNEPSTWEVLERVKALADKYQVSLLPEIHASYEEKIYQTIAQKGYMTYDFFLPGLIIDAIESGEGNVLQDWAQEIQTKKMKVVNMLGCHDGIPLLDLKGIIPEERIQTLIRTIVQRGGYVKDLHGQKNIYYQVNATYYSALGENDQKMLLARALQLFMPGKPQIWYLDLFAGKNDYEAVKQAGAGGHKEINRTNLTLEQIEEGLQQKIVQQQIELIRFRANFPAFGFDSHLDVACHANEINFTWEKEGYTATLHADLKDFIFEIYATDHKGERVYQFLSK